MKYELDIGSDHLFDLDHARKRGKKSARKAKLKVPKEILPKPPKPPKVEKKQEEEIDCMICLTAAVEKTKLNRCSHFFCFECISKWVQVTNCCPLCKVPSLSLHRNGTKETLRPDGSIHHSRTIQKIRIKAKTQHFNPDDPQNWAPDFADVCYECGDCGENDASLMVCDHCDYKVCHFKCAGFSEVPKTNWFCKFCL